MGSSLITWVMQYYIFHVEGSIYVVFIFDVTTTDVVSPSIHNLYPTSFYFKKLSSLSESKTQPLCSYISILKVPLLHLDEYLTEPFFCLFSNLC